MTRGILAGGLATLVLAWTAPARAQAVDAQVAGLLQQAAAAYEQTLDVEAAAGYLDRAVELVRQNGLLGTIAAQAYAMRGVVYLWLGDEAQALELFRWALGADPGVQVPPAWHAPAVDRLLAQARTEGPLAPPPPELPPAMRHAAVREQLWNHPVPIYVDVNPGLPIAGVQLFYRSLGETNYQAIQLGRSGPGYYVELPCSILQPRLWEYYLVAVDADGRSLGSEGEAERPFRIDMVEELTGPAPTRPGGTLVSSCRDDGRASGGDCPPGIPCEGAPVCRSCVIFDDCYGGEVCSNGCCGPRPADPDEGGAIGLWIDVSLGLGVGVTTGTAKEPAWYLNGAGDYVFGPDDSRTQTDFATGFGLGGGAARVGLGYFIIPELSVAVNARIGFPPSPDPFGDFPWLAEGRVAWWFTFAEAHKLGVYVSGGAGILVHEVGRVTFDQGSEYAYLNLGLVPCIGSSSPRATCKLFEPFYKTSGFGTVGFGAQYLYMLFDWFGVGGELAMNAMFPSVSFNMDFLADVRFLF